MFSRHRHNTEEQELASSEYWMTFSDLMAGLLMVFAVALIAMMVSALSSQRISENKEERLVNLEQRVEDQIGIRRTIIERLRNEFAGIAAVQVDEETGFIGIGDKILFRQGEATLAEEGKPTIDEVMRVYESVFFGSDDFEQYLSRIVVEGHTNDDYSGPRENAYIYNLDLSQQRAFNVMEYIVESHAQSPIGEKLKRYLVASGRSFMDMVRTGHRVDKVASRRIEIKFLLRDEETIAKVQTLLEGGV
jgi:chemotaxis protein MotB